MDGHAPSMNGGNLHQALLDEIPVAVFRCKCDAERSLQFIGAVIEEISGYAPDALVDNSQRSFASLIHRDDIAAVVDRLRLAHATAGRYEIDYRIVAADGQVRWLEERGRVGKSGGTACVDGILIDITERKQSELALRNSEAFFRELTNLSSEWQWVQDANFCFTWFSAGNTFFYDDKDKQAVGRPRWELLIHPMSREAMAQHRIECEAHLPFRNFEYAIISGDGVPVWDSTSGNPVFAADGSFQGYRGIASNIDARKRAEVDALRATLQEFDVIFRSVSVGIAFLQDRRIVRANKTFLDMFGYEESAVTGQSTRIYYPSEDAYEAMADAYAALAGGQTVASVEVVMRRADGTNFLCAHTGSLVDPGNPTKGSIWTYQDITDQRAAEAKLAQTMQELEAILDNAWTGIFVTSGERKIMRMNRYAERVFQCGPDGYTGQSTRSLFSSDQDYDAFTQKVQAAAAANVAIEYSFCRKDGTCFLAKSVGSLLDPANPGKGAIWLVTDITEQRADEEKLAQTLGELNIIFRNVGIGIGYTKDRRFVRVNSALSEMTGYSESELIGKTGQIYLSDEAFQSVGRGYAVMATGQTFKVEVPMRRADGSSFLCVHTGTLLDPGDPSRASIWTYQDITAEREAEDKLERTLSELEIIFQNASIGIAFVQDRRIVRVNSAFSKMSGFEPAALIGQSTRIYYPSDEAWQALAVAYDVFAGGETVFKREVMMRRADDTDLLCSITGSPVDPDDMGKGAIWLHQDITEQRAAEDKLTQAMGELDVIFQNASIGIVYVVDRRFVRLNKTFEAICGYSAAELIGQSTRKIYASEEVYQSCFPLYAELALGRSVTGVNIRLRRPDGAEVICEMAGSLVDASNPQKGVIVLYQDVTEQRASEEKLIRTLSELDIIFNNASVAIAFLVDRRFVRVNRTFETMFGWSSAELIGQTARRFYASDEAFAAVGKAIADLPAGETVLRLESEARRADGSEILCEAACSYVDPSEKSKGMIWLFTDVTELRRMQAALQNARDDALARNALIEQQHQLVTNTLNQVATLLNNSGQGFLSFGRDMLIEEGFSRECQRIFGRDVLDLPLPELLCPEAATQRGFVQKTLRLIMDSADDPLRRDAYIGLLPAEYRLGERYCKAEYRLLDDERMMLILTDVSDQKLLKERLTLERLRLEFVVHALESRDDLLAMLRDFETFRSRVLPDLLSFERQPQTLLAEVYRQIHTFKSLFAQASLPTIPEVLHDLESRLGQLRDLGNSLDNNDIKRELGATDLGAAVEQDMALLRQKLGDDFFNSEREIRVPASKLASLEEEASTLYGNDSRMLGLIRYLRYVPLCALIEPHFKAAEQLAQRQDKLLAPITCTGDAAPVDPEVYGPFCKSLVHLFRNAVDHGVEDVDTRLMADKSETAAIRCVVQTTGSRLALTIADDGYGIDAALIRAKAIEQGKVGAGETASMSDADALMLIFADGVTTSEEITAISGRGVGLGAVQQELMLLGGTVRVESVVGHGTRFEFTLPYQPPVVAKAQATGYASARKFLDPLPGVVQAFCKSHLKLEVTVDPTLHEFTANGLFDFTALLSLGVGLSLSIGLSIERPLLLEMTRRFEPDFPEDEIEELADSVGAEIANTVVGNATVYFTHLAHHVAMGTPDIVSQEERAEKIGPRAFRGFKGHGDAGSFMIFCILTEEHPV